MTDIIIILVLLVMSAVFSGCEMAFSSVNKIRLKNYAAQGNKRAVRALEVTNRFDDAPSSSATTWSTFFPPPWPRWCSPAT